MLMRGPSVTDFGNNKRERFMFFKTKSAKNKLDRVISLLAQHRDSGVRFYGIQAATLNREVVAKSNVTNTIATNGTDLIACADFINEQTDEHLAAILIHEAVHKVARHAYRLSELPGQHEQEIMHIAADNAVNLLLQDSNLPFRFPDGSLADPRFRDKADWENDWQNKPWHAEKIFRTLIDEMPEMPNKDSQSGDGNQSSETDSASGNQPDSGGDQYDDKGENNNNDQQDKSQEDNSQKSGDSDQGQQPEKKPEQPKPKPKPKYKGKTTESMGDLLPAKAPEDGGKSENQAQQETIMAAQIVGIGNLPPEIRELVELNTQGIAERDWLQELKHWLQTIVDKSDYSLRVPNRRYAQTGVIMPSLRNPAVRAIGVAVDTSGSMSTEELQKALDQIKNVVDELAPQEIVVIRHNAEPYGLERYHVGEDVNPLFEAGGGTEVQGTFKKLEQEDLDAVIWISDCMVNDWPEETQWPLIILNTQGDETSRGLLREYNGEAIATAIIDI